jgi:peroxiredoxin
VVFAAVQKSPKLLILLAAGLIAATLTAGAAAPQHRLLGQKAPDFALKSSAGSNVRLSEHRGDVVVLSFFGSRCGQCGAQLAAVDRLVATYGSAGLRALAVNVDDNQVAAGEYIAGHRVGFPLLLNPEKTVARVYRIDALPTLLLIDRAGAIRYVHRDYRNGREMQYLDQIKTLLDE